MHLSPVSIALLILFGLLVLQSLGGFLQIKNYQEAVRRVHKLGNVGVGQKRGLFTSGHVAIIACDNEGVITGAEVMDGFGVWARFHPVDSFLGIKLLGSSIYDFMEITKAFDKRSFKRHQGYVRAFEALEARLTGKELTREQEKHMEQQREKKDQ